VSCSAWMKKLSSLNLALLMIILSLGGLAVTRSSGSSDQGNAVNGWASASNGLTGPPASQHSVWFGDINNDGKLDIATGGYEGVRVWRGDGAGNWVLNSTNLPTGSYDGGVCLGDINNDGNLDLAAANYDYGSAGVTVWRGNGAGVWTLASTGLPTVRGHTGIFFGNVDHDGNLDLAVTSDVFESNPGGIQVFRGNGAGQWTPASTGLPTSGKYYAVWMGDVNNDGNDDLAASGPGLHVWLGNGAGVWTESSNGLPSTDQWNSVTLGDINLDGNMDIVSAMDMGGHGIKAWLGDGSGNWSPVSTGLPTTGLFYGVVLADLVGDKYPDILAGQYNGGGIKIFRGIDGSSWAGDSAGMPAGKVIGVAAGDINNDGYMDIGAVGESFGVQVFKNTETSPLLTATVKQPNGGESWEILTQHYINWTATGGTPPLTISIAYSVAGIPGPYSVIAAGEANDGSYLWTVPNSPSDVCYVRVNVTDSASRQNWDKSNSSFTIFLADPTPPAISNLQPPNLTITGDATPAISASYSDASGIALASVALEVDSVNVTSSATVTPSGVTYTPATPLSEGTHNVHLEVRDNYIAHNLATASWSFVVDTLWPTVSNLQPANQTTISNSMPPISAGYSDASGIDLGSVVLKVDSVDVTGSASVLPASVRYVPATPLIDGNHDIYLQVGDNSVPQNKAKVTWWFTIDTTIPDTTPPTITNLLPVNHSIISDSTPAISASYSDSSGVDTTSLVLKLDSVDVTSSATVTAFDISYMPASLLSDAMHYVSLVLEDQSLNRNMAVATWQFKVDTTPPVVMSMDPTNQTTITATTPDVVASYADASGIDIASVMLKLDSIDVTSSSVIFLSDVTYTPPSPLAFGRHDVFFSVRDIAGPPNTAIRTWWFVIDNVPPAISNVQPTDQYITSIKTPTISANYDDPSGIALASVAITLDSVNVTSGANVAPDGFTYLPPSALSEGIHSVYLEVSDASGLHNKNTSSWQFTVDSLPPAMVDLRPANHTIITTKRPVITANYSDASGVDVLRTVLRLDSTDVTSSASVTDSGFTFALMADLPDGLHSVLLFLHDKSYPSNNRVVQWDFTIDTTAPYIVHTPVTSGTAGRDITIRADVTDPSGLGYVHLYYRKTGAQQYMEVDMVKGSGNTFSAAIPGSAFASDGVQYYIEANDTVGNIGRRPQSNWLTSPYNIDIESIPPPDNRFWMPVILIVASLISIGVAALLYFLKRKRKNEEGKDAEGNESQGP